MYYQIKLPLNTINGYNVYKYFKKRNFVLEVNKDMVIQFIELQRRGLGLKKAEVNFDNCDWDLLIRHSYRNKTTMLINNAVNKERMNYDIDEHTLSDWNNLSRQLFFRGIRQLSRYKEIMKMLQDNDIKPVVLKGYALAQLYPDIIQRYSSDLDIKFEESDKKRVTQLFKDFGLKHDIEDSKENVYIFYDDSISIEAHFTLWEDYEGRNIDVLRREHLDDPRTIIPVHLGESDIPDGYYGYTLGVTEHLILQMFHVIKHFILEGIEIRYMVDLTLFINKYASEIDFDRFWRVMSDMEFEEYTVIYFSECIKFFDMTEKALNGRKFRLADDEYAFLNDMMMVGKQSLDDTSSFSMLGILGPYVNGGKKPAIDKKGRVLDALFPSAENIDKKYGYCKKYHCLLPVAWVHRALRTIFMKITRGNKVYGASGKIKGAEYRISMMQNAGMLRE